MGTALYKSDHNEPRSPCRFELGPGISWRDDLPLDLTHLVVAPVKFDVARDYEMWADHTQVCDARNQPCYCEFRFVLTQLRSDDDEVFYEAPVYAESVRSWRLVDERWLVCKDTVENFEPSVTQTHLYLSYTMPR